MKRKGRGVKGESGEKKEEGRGGGGDWGERGEKRLEGEEERERTAKLNWRNLVLRVHCVKDTKFIVALW